MICKYCGKRGFKNKKGLATHRDFQSSKKCYKKWRSEQNKIWRSKPKVKCEICGKFLRNISNTHLKTHNITQNNYKKIFPNKKLFANGLLELQNERRETTISKRYTPEEINRLKGKKSVESKLKKYKNISYSDICKLVFKRKVNKDPKFLEELRKRTSRDVRHFYKKLKKDKLKNKEYESKRLFRRIETNKNKYGIDFPQKLEETKNKHKETLIRKYGSVENAYKTIIKNALKSRFKNFGKFSYYCPVFSKDSQILFNILRKTLPKKFICHYATNGNKNANNEFPVLVNGKDCCFRFLDFYVPELNKCIEYDEKFHFNLKQIASDRQREREIKKKIKGIKILRISYKDFLESKEKVVKQCVKFLLQ
jgi:hypothetical protein